MAYLDTVVDLKKGENTEYGLNMLSYQIGPSIETGRYIKPPSSMFPVALKKKTTIRKIRIQLEFIAKDFNEVATNIALFTQKLQDGVDLYLPDGYGYFCLVDDVSEPEQVTSWISTVEFDLVGIRHGNKATHTLTNGSEFNVGGMTDVEAVVKIAPKTAPAEATIVITNASGDKLTDISVSSIKKTVVVDGISKKVTEAGVNKFGDTEMFEFPKIGIGKNTVAIAGDVNVTVEYYPLYL